MHELAPARASGAAARMWDYLLLAGASMAMFLTLLLRVTKMLSEFLQPHSCLQITKTSGRELRTGGQLSVHNRLCYRYILTLRCFTLNITP